MSARTAKSYALIPLLFVLSTESMRFCHNGNGNGNEGNTKHPPPFSHTCSYLPAPFGPYIHRLEHHDENKCPLLVSEPWDWNESGDLYMTAGDVWSREDGIGIPVPEEFKVLVWSNDEKFVAGGVWPYEQEPYWNEFFEANEFLSEWNVTYPVAKGTILEPCEDYVEAQVVYSDNSVDKMQITMSYVWELQTGECIDGT